MSDSIALDDAYAKDVASYWIANMPGAEEPQVWGMGVMERLKRQLKGMEDVTDICELHEDESLIMLRGDVLYDQPVLDGLVASKPGTMLIDGEKALAAHIRPSQAEEAKSWFCIDGPAPDCMTGISSAELGEAYNHKLRKRAPAAAHILTDTNTQDVEWKMFMTSYKGVVDFVTKYVWPVPAFHVTRLCVKHEITPNKVTVAGAGLMFLALILFWNGFFALGLLAGWIMTFLDTVDGKLARVTMNTSKRGHTLDHGIDLFHPPFWYIAWGIGLAAYGTPLADGWLSPVLTTMFAFYVLGRLAEGFFIARFRMHIHVWRRFDSFFREILARRNPNMVLLTGFLIAGRPDYGLLAITAWTVITFIVHVVQCVQAEQYRKRGEPIESWLNS